MRVGLGVGERSRPFAPPPPAGLRDRVRLLRSLFLLFVALRLRSRLFGGSERERERSAAAAPRFLGCGLRERVRSLCFAAGCELRERSRLFGGGLRDRSRLLGGGLREREPLFREDDDEEEDDDPLELDELEREPDPELLRDELLSEELNIVGN